MKLEGIAAFVAIAEAGAVSGAGRELNLSKSVVSERLKELERSPGAQLSQRTTRKLSITVEGNAFLERARPMVQEAVAARSAIAEHRGQVAGPLRISAPVSFGALRLGRALHPFLLSNPGIQLTLDLDDRFVDVAADGFDAVIRHGNVADARVIARRIATSKRHFVASPAYLKKHGVARSPVELEGHMAVLYSNRDADWRLKVARGHLVVRPTRFLRVNNGLVMRDAAVGGGRNAVFAAFFVGTPLCRRAL